MIENVKCPKCGGPMASRVQGASGQRFWGCKAYPACRGTRDTDGNAPHEREVVSRNPAEDLRDEGILPSARRSLGPRWRQ